MKKRVLSLLLALAVVMSVMPVPAFAVTGAVPEEYRGKYECMIEIGNSYYPATITITKDHAVLSIPDFYFDQEFSYSGHTNGQICFDGLDATIVILANPNAFNVLRSATLYSSYFSENSNRLSNFQKVSDRTNSTLSTGSSLILPIAAAVLVIGAAIYVGKRKSKKVTE